MADKEEKERRKQILAALQKQAEDEFEQALPMERSNFTKLFDHLDEALSLEECDDTNILTKSYLEKIGVDNVDVVLEWLAKNGGYCDCEILANVEDMFE